MHHPHHHRPGSIISKQFWTEAGQALAPIGNLIGHSFERYAEDTWIGMNAAWDVTQKFAINAFGQASGFFLEEVLPVMKQLIKDMYAAAMELVAFLDWLFCGGQLCNLSADDWSSAFGNAFSWGGFSGLGATDFDFESCSNAILCIMCSVNWLMFEYVWPMWTLVAAVVGMIVEKCNVLGGVNPSIEFCFSITQGFTMPGALIVSSRSVSVGWALAITAYAEKQCYIFMCISAKWTIPFPTLMSTGSVDLNDVGFNICLCGSPSLDGFVNLWSLSGKLYILNPKTMTAATVTIQCGFFYIRYWFKFNAISVLVVGSVGEPELKSPIEITFGLSTAKVWVPLCVMSFVTKSCRMYFTGAEFNIGNQWDSYENSGGVSHGSSQGDTKGFQGYE